MIKQERLPITIKFCQRFAIGAVKLRPFLHVITISILMYRKTRTVFLRYITGKRHVTTKYFKNTSQLAGNPGNCSRHIDRCSSLSPKMTI